MKTRFFKISAAVVMIVMSSSMVFAQTKNAQRYDDGSVNKVRRTFFRTDFDQQFSLAAYYSFPFIEDGSDLNKYGSRVEFGYLTPGQCGFYSGLAWQYNGYKVKDYSDYKINCHHILLPEQFSVRFAPGNVPIQLRVGPFIGFNVAASFAGKSVPDRDVFEWGFQFNFKVGCFTMGYTLPVGDKSKAYLGNGLLSLGLVADF